MVKNDTKTYSLDEINDMNARNNVVATKSDAPEYEIDKSFWKNARVVMPHVGKTHFGFRVDNDVLEWFKSSGKGYQTRMNAILRSYFEAHEDKPSNKNI